MLAAQRPRSDEHDELLFIVIHQVYELWFKQLLHELRHLQGRLGDGDTSHAIRTLRRVLTILKVAVAQIDVLETMSPRQFSAFRDRLEAASGFQSWQFRELEAVLGRRDPAVLRAYPEGSPARAAIEAAMARPPLFASYLTYLERHGYAVGAAQPGAGSTDAVEAVLLAVYRDDGGPAQLAEHLVDLDEGLQEWRYRHVKMVERTIGDKGRDGRVGRRRVPALHAVGAGLPRPLGRAEPPVSTTPVTVADLRRSPNALAEHYRRFGVGGPRILLSGHSHQAWPDAAEEGLRASFADAAAAVDAKWALAEAQAEAVRAGYRRLLDDPSGHVALGPNTHDLVVKLLSALDLRRRPRVVTTDGEFHSLRRQLDRLAEEGLEVVRVPAEPAATLAERMAAAVDDRTALAAVSAVMFLTSRRVPDLGALVPACQRHGTELLVDAYHALGPVPFPIHQLGLADAWVTGGGYKYLQLGEGNAFLRLPPHGAELRPAVTGWFAEFEELTRSRDAHRVTYAPGGARFAGGTYDPASHYRAARVLRFFEEHGLVAPLLEAVYQHQLAVLADAFDALDVPPAIVDRDRDVPLEALGGFLSLQAPRAAELQAALAARGVLTDSRADRLRVGPAPYLSDDQLVAGMAALGEVVADLERV